MRMNELILLVCVVGLLFLGAEVLQEFGRLPAYHTNPIQVE